MHYALRWFALGIVLSSCATKIALADAIDSWTTWSTAQPYVSKQVPPNAMIMRGKGTDAYYVLEADPATGAIPVDINSGTVTVDIDYSGAPGSPVPSDAAYVGGTDAGTLRGIHVDSSGDVQVDVGSSSGRSFVTTVINPYGSIPVTSLAWVEVIASTSATINAFTLFDSSGQTLELGTGAAMAETRKLLIPPGGIDGLVPLAIPSGTRVSVRAISTSATVGELAMTFFN